MSIIWDGRNQSEFYEENWKNYFKNQVDSMLKNSTFIRIIVNLTALNKTSKNLKKLHYRLSNLIKNKFEIQVFKKKGLVLKSA